MGSIDAEVLLRELRVEEERSNRLLHLTANESWLSDAALRMQSLRLGERYVMGPGEVTGVEYVAGFTFTGYPAASTLLDAANQAARRMLGAEVVTCSPLSGVHAMMSAILSLTEPGDHVVCVDPSTGGHFATGEVLSRSGRSPVFVPYHHQALCLDPHEVADAVRSSGASAVYIDVSSTTRAHDLVSIRSALGPEPLLIYDASHVIGLIMGGRFQDPLSEGADVIVANTHKTLPGPQKGLLAFRDEAMAVRAIETIESGLISSTHTGAKLALAVTLLEMREFGHAYATQVIDNANALGTYLSDRGLHVRRTPEGPYTQNHQLHLFCDDFGTPFEVASRLLESRISCNVDRAIGSRPYLRIGTQELTRRGMAVPEMLEIARLLDEALSATGCSATAGRQVSSLVGRFSGSAFSFRMDVDG